SGHREFIPGQVRAAVATGCDGIFMEVHDDVNNALSDASTQWPLEELEPLLVSMVEFRKAYLSNG
ncbi:MAG: 3-deoxy-8-phosphooctulonate synthase, partial [Candidatus Neomarinimicrobiota bacterium]|nr:3-deoxy-8-phosphooctulonate synthase [Candidatus Neomarinimicrobiota bacterium]